MFSMTARVCSRMSSCVVPSASDVGAGNGIVSAARTGSGDEQKISRALHVRILPARRGLAFNDFAFDFAHTLPIGDQSRMQILFSSE